MQIKCVQMWKCLSGTLFQKIKMLNRCILSLICTFPGGRAAHWWVMDWLLRNINAKKSLIQKNNCKYIIKTDVKELHKPWDDFDCEKAWIWLRVLNICLNRGGVGLWCWGALWWQEVCFIFLTFPSPGRHIACLSKFWKATREKADL